MSIEQPTPEERVSSLEQAARMQVGMNEAIVQAVLELYEMVKTLMPETESEPEALTGMALIRQMLAEQQMQNGNSKADVSIEQLRKWNQERKDNRGASE
jgi:hypothetical protein